MERRDFIKASTAIGAATFASPYILKGDLIATQQIEQLDFMANDNIMIIIELAGGNDGLNTIMQADSDVYHNIRPEIGIALQDAKQWDKTDLYMHPAMVTNLYNEGMMGLLKNGNLAVLEGVGYDEYTMSHFRGQDIYGSGMLSTDPKVKLLEGWLGRYFATKLPNYPLVIPEHPLAINIGGYVPLAFRSKNAEFGIALNNIDKFYQQGAGLTPKDAQLAKASFYTDEYNFIHVVAKQSEEYSKAIKTANDKGKNMVQYGGGLGDKLGMIAKLISGGLKTKVYYVQQGGYDMHIQEMRDIASGQHPSLLAELSGAISNFMKDATLQGFVDRVAGLTITEFGRRAHENGSRGADHGSACVQFVFASNKYLDGGRKGNRPDLNDLDENTNIRHQFDFRRIYTDFLESWFGATPQETETLFGEKVFPIGVLKQRTTGVEGYLETYNQKAIKITPNPVSEFAKLEFELKTSSNVVVEVYNLKGFRQIEFYNGKLEAGIYSYRITSLPIGTYIANVAVDGKRYVEQFNVVR